MNAELTNALMNQRNEIAATIERSEDAADLKRAERLIDFVADIWTALDYDYKLVELRRRVSDKAKRLANQEREYIKGLRKNDKTIGAARFNLERLEAMA